VDEAFAGFPEAAGRLKARKVTTTGTPVRAQFQPRNAANCRAALGLEPNRPTVLVMGGSQGASGINEMILKALFSLATRAPEIQWLHLTGSKDVDRVRTAYKHLERALVTKKSVTLPALSLREAEARLRFKFVIKPFCNEMDLALGSATAAVSRAGASSLAELAAMRLPALLVPYPAAADNHQFHNARAWEMTGAARLLEQKNATPEKVAAALGELVENETTRGAVQAALAQWHTPHAAEQIVEFMLQAVACEREPAVTKAHGCGCGCAPGRARHATS
jgi:UDP-N-acetylglucosamine--N-acetylmuramyl-(pentapeptide) pyrophosphoryl-undecaprenol N-acetylglucosamine transferase